MGQAGRRPSRRAGRTPARRRARRRTSVVPTAGTVAAAVAVGLVLLGAPATELAAQVTASWAPFHAAGTTVDLVPQVPQVVAQSGVDVPEPPLPAPGVVLAVPHGVDIEVVPPTVPRGVIPEFTPPPAPCGGYGTPRHILPGVVPGAGTATLSWLADSSDSTVRGYRVQAVSQALTGGTQAEPAQQLVAQRDDCGEVGTTLTGLTSGDVYVFWLEEQVWEERTQRMRYLQVGTTDPIRIL